MKVVWVAAKVQLRVRKNPGDFLDVCSSPTWLRGVFHSEGRRVRRAERFGEMSFAAAAADQAPVNLCVAHGLLSLDAAFYLVVDLRH